MMTSIATLMTESGVAFGTSGARGLVTHMSDLVCYAYTKAFLQHLRATRQFSYGAVVLGGDLRPSTDRIARACALGVEHASAPDNEYQVTNFGKISSPALALYGLENKIPTIMVTGSHIPDDRNGIKFTTPLGEITKADELAIKNQVVDIPDDIFNRDGSILIKYDLSLAINQAQLAYRNRYLNFFGAGFLEGRRIGVYQHSAVLRDELVVILEALGAAVTVLGRSETFIPVDTEAIRPEDRALAKEWAKTGSYDAIVSVDGDSDRPLISDEVGNWLRGDVAGILCARYLDAQAVVTPVSSNSALEKSSYFKQVRRSKIGSPFVIEEMMHLLKTVQGPIVGYEANGGFLLATAINRQGKILSALPTRDALIVQLAILGLAQEEKKSISSLVAELPARYTYSERIKDFPTQASVQMLEDLNPADTQQALHALEQLFGSCAGEPESIDTTDGLRVTFKSGEVIHLRPSGNAPELRCYTEADTLERAEYINAEALAKVRGLIS
jgi:phosphomannomutase